ncbi:MAG: class I SAM-dependent methyltransferase, partial [Chloroflexota bacterium]|nr:class I SAM-dependent methyltransferase [Chloroflexota bacterium]
MDKEIAEKLLALNREFYAAFAQSFAASRSISDPALTAILPYIPSRARVLDVGCGNGRLALLLNRERPGATYLGLDAEPALVWAARAQANRFTNVAAEFHVADITQLDIAHWTLDIDNWSLITCLATLHHIPSFSLRTRVLRDMAGLLYPGGRLILSTWQFLENERMRRKIVDWAEIDIAVEALEPGDYLL